MCEEHRNTGTGRRTVFLTGGRHPYAGSATLASAAKRVDRRARRPPPGVLAVFTHPVFLAAGRP